MTEFESRIAGFPVEREYFIAVDSDGCVFDNMDIKHKECFCPAFIDNMELQAVSGYARQTWDFVNLYSRLRGINRFKGLVKSLDLLRKRPEVIARGVEPLLLRDLENWISRESRLGMDSLEAEARRLQSDELRRVIRWSEDVNRAVDKIVRGVAPFEHVEEALAAAVEKADCMVVSSAPLEHIEREWEEHGIRKYVKEMAGQEMGGKAANIRLATQKRYAPDRILMIGDAPGDLEAARENGALFYPIIPGRENVSWQELLKTGLQRFFDGSFRGGYQQNKIDDFLNALPEVPDWEKLAGCS